jgi:eukaryotic-like serine/threonine-protein kinase
MPNACSTKPWPSPQERAAFLRGACGEDHTLRRQVESLLAAHEETGPFLPTEPADQTVQEAPAEGPGSVIGRYKLLQQIGEGGMGMVYMAEQTAPVIRKVALKIIRLGMDTRQVVARFEAERQALALMDHPNIAKVLDAGATDTGRPYFVMELVRGIPITEYCDKNHLSASQRLELFIPVCQAIQHAHQKGIIHRDIKPSNILVTLHDGQPLPMVIDFGIAKAVHQRLTEKTLYTNFAQMIGTPAYMSPEQAEMSKLDVDTRTDIYALGVLLYELLTGTTPFSSKELLDAGFGAMQRILAEQEPPRPSTRLSTMQQAQRTSVALNRRMEVSALARLFQGDLDWIVMKCLEKERGRRYETASALAADLQRHLHSEPVAARPPTAAYRLQKAIRRNRVAFAAGGAVMLALVLGFAAAAWQAVRATNAEREQVTLREKAEKAAQEQAEARQAAVAARTLAEDSQGKERQERQRAEASEQGTRLLLYVANMNLVQQAWEDDNIGLMQQLLDETADSPYRGFEWYYWQRQIHGEIVTLHGHTKGVTAVVYSPDGQQLVSGSSDGTVRVWDLPSNQSVLVFKAGLVSSVAYSPDAKRILTGGWDHMGKVWETATGKQLLTLEGHTDPVNSVAYSPDGQRIATASDDRTSRIWDAIDGRELLTLDGHEGAVRSVEFSPDGRRIATASEDRKARIWDAANGKLMLALPAQDPVDGVTFSPDGDRLLTTGDGYIKWWDGTTGAELTFGTPESEPYRCARFSPDGRSVAAISGGGIRLWEPAIGRELTTHKGHSRGVWSIAFSPDGSQIASGGGEGAIKLWDAASRMEGVSLSLKQHGTWMRPEAFSRDGTRLAGSCEGAIVVWETATGRELLSVQRGPQDSGPVAFSPDGQRIVSGSLLFDTKTGRFVPSSQPAALIRDATTGNVLTTLRGLTAPVAQVAYSPDGLRVLTGSSDGSVRVWDASNGQRLLTLVGHRYISSCVSYSPDGRRILTSSPDQTVRVWDAESGKQLYVQTPPSMVYAAAFSADGSRFLTGGADGTVRLCEAATGRELLTLTGHGSQIYFVGFAPDETRIITSSDDSTVRLWEVKDGKEVLKVRAPSVLGPLHWSTDGQRFLAVVDLNPQDARRAAAWLGTTHGIRTWEAATPDEVARWQREEREAEESLAKSRVVEHTAAEVPDRSAGLPAHLIDLSAHYNASPRDDWHNPNDPGNNLASLPSGAQEIGGVRFDVRGIVQLASTFLAEFRPDYPDTVTGIPIEQVAAKLHFLHGTGWSTGEPEEGERGVEIARYVIHYADGQTTEAPVRYAEDVRNWQFMPETDAMERGGAQPVWKGPQERWRESWSKAGVRLYLKTWVNPRPNVRIESLDFVSTFTASAPFLLAITADPPAATSPP